MNHVERFKNVMSFKPVNRLPVIEWAAWWDLTLDRWYKEGLPQDLCDPSEIRDFWGLDCYQQEWITPIGKSCTEPPTQGAGIIHNEKEYLDVRQHLYPQPAFDKEKIKAWASKQEQGDLVIWITFEGFFWHPRTLLGIENHLYAFKDQPGLLHKINQDLLDYNLNALEDILSFCTPNFMTFAEDMSYNHGPMISQDMFETHLSPFYRKIVPELKTRKIIPFIDSDGDVTRMIPWLESVGMRGILPLERRSGVDVFQIRKDHPRFKMIGGFDKTVLHQGEEPVKAEFERLLPVMQQGGFIPSVDHQTPPDTSFGQYRSYVSLLKEYCGRL